MYTEVLNAISSAAAAKVQLCRSRLPAFLIHSAMAGAYVGLGIVLILSLGAPLAAAKSPVTGLVMGTTFGIALSLVVFAGSDLFTGNTMVLPVGALAGRIPWGQAVLALGFSYAGNLLGSVLVAWLAARAGTLAADPGLAFVTATAAKKMHLGFWPLFFRGILCNWLVVLGVWSAFRLKSEAGKLMMIFWCLLGFIGSGYEHSVANMTLLTLANLLPHGPEISWMGMVNNLVPVTLGNIISGVVFMGLAYWCISPVRTEQAADLHKGGHSGGTAERHRTA